MYTSAQVRIHAHNDYQKPEPLINALNNKVFSLEADVWLVNDTLKVAHDARELPTAPTLFSQYLQPIIQLFENNKGHISSDKKYAPVLMVDIKENGEAALTALVKSVAAYPTVFNRNVNPLAVQLVISGERGDNWLQWPSYILFDGRPYEQYNAEVLQRIAFISDSYINFLKFKDSTDTQIKQSAEKIHAVKKLFRLWTIPDSPSSWEKLLDLGVDIINTDKVAECSMYFKNKQ